MKRGIKAIIFDIGGVLQIGTILKKPIRRHTHYVHEFIVKKLKIPLDQYFDSIDTAYAKSIEGKISKKKTISILSQNLKISPKKLERLYFKAYKKNFRRNKQLFKKVFVLRKQGSKIAILSDQWHLSKDALIEKRDAKKFDAVVVSCDVGVRKPDPKIYKIVLKKLNLPASQTIFIDNQEWNLVPAKKLGMKTILFKDNEQLFREFKKLGIK